MAARQHTVRLYTRNGWGIKLERDVFCDPRDEQMLRQLLEQLATEHSRVRRFDLAEYRLVVHNPGGGQVQAEITVDSAGRSVIKR